MIKIFYYILMMYAGAFAIGMFVSVLIWVLLRTMNPSKKRKRIRHSLQEMKQIQ